MLSNTKLSYRKLWRFVKNAALLTVEMHFDMVYFVHSSKATCGIVIALSV